MKYYYKHHKNEFIDYIESFKPLNEFEKWKIMESNKKERYKMNFYDDHGHFGCIIDIVALIQ